MNEKGFEDLLNHLKAIIDLKNEELLMISARVQQIRDALFDDHHDVALYQLGNLNQYVLDLVNQ